MNEYCDYCSINKATGVYDIYDGEYDYFEGTEYLCDDCKEGYEDDGKACIYVGGC